MDPEIKRKLDILTAKVDENHRLIKKIRNRQRTAAMIKVIYWVLIIGIALGAYYYVKPLYESLVNAYTQGSENLKSLGNISVPGIPNITNLLR